MSNRFVADFFGTLAAVALVDEAASARRRAEARRMEEIANLRARLTRLENGSNCGSDVPLSPAGVGALLAVLRKESFDHNRVPLVYGLSRGISAYEAAAILAAFDFDDPRLEAANYLYTLVTDKQNWPVVAEAFSFSSNARTAMKGRV